MRPVALSLPTHNDSDGKTTLDDGEMIALALCQDLSTEPKILIDDVMYWNSEMYLVITENRSIKPEFTDRERKVKQ